MGQTFSDTLDEIVERPPALSRDATIAQATLEAEW
jgi:hypothetical protein